MSLWTLWTFIFSKLKIQVSRCWFLIKWISTKYLIVFIINSKVNALLRIRLCLTLMFDQTLRQINAIYFDLQSFLNSTKFGVYWQKDWKFDALSYFRGFPFIYFINAKQSTKNQRVWSIFRFFLQCMHVHPLILLESFFYAKSCYYSKYFFLGYEVVNSFLQFSEINTFI